jgi:outer membrane protein
MMAALTPLLLVLVLQPARVVTLEQAERSADAHQPQLGQARANTQAGAARAEQARAPVLPEVKIAAEYERTTGNRPHKPGDASTVVNSGKTYNWYEAAATGSFVLWDFGQTRGRWRAAQARTQSLASTELATGLQVILEVRTAYFQARAQKALLAVAREAFGNQERHFEQISGFVQAGTRPEIDLAQARADRATARVQVITAENNYAVARAQLNAAMGIGGPIDYDVGDETFPEVDAESRPAEALVDQALRGRPDFVALDDQIRAAELTRQAAQAGYLPTLSLIGGASDQGIDLTRTRGIGTTSTGLPRGYNAGLAWNYFGGINLVWPIFQGFLTRGQVREAEALLSGLRAQRDGLVQQAWVTVQQAQLGVRAARETLAASDEALTAARQRLALAEGRYQAGAGNAIELGDAQLGFVTAGAQKVSAEYRLASARAELLFALGRR